MDADHPGQENCHQKQKHRLVRHPVYDEYLQGCSHGCIYCDSRSECYGVQDFDTVRVKSDALAVIRNDLRSKTQSGVVATGSMSDPYNPFEKELQLTRHALELLDAYGFGAAVATKGTLITRDADILREIASHSPVLSKITVTTCDDALAASWSRARLRPRRGWRLWRSWRGRAFLQAFC